VQDGKTYEKGGVIPGRPGWTYAMALEAAMDHAKREFGPIAAPKEEPAAPSRSTFRRRRRNTQSSCPKEGPYRSGYLKKWVMEKLGMTKAQLDKSITDQTTDMKDIEEAVELGTITHAREIATSAVKVWERIKDLYTSQPTLSQRTSTSVDLQQYSTPLPLSYLMQRWSTANLAGAEVYEPTAGTGALLFTINPKATHVLANELDDRRRKILEDQGSRLPTRTRLRMP